MTADKAPSEFVLVPREPTPEMMYAMLGASPCGKFSDNYRAMLAASPSVGAVPQGDANVIACELDGYGSMFIGPTRAMCERAAALIRQQQAALASQAARMGELEQDARIGAAFRDISARNYGDAFASLFIAHVLEKVTDDKLRGEAG